MRAQNNNGRIKKSDKYKPKWESHGVSQALHANDMEFTKRKII